ncbi:O-acetyltransferase PaAT-1 [Fulvia fulva]|uniref:O-acetyltransferase PaAT-1 n=1 Tax=Passalora fulva TaxID=5499 RepID=A0A9Q8LD77_PASFU|nr:O-acetyltransferase PaAT-1 [Fulvia fulva]KAK4629116.1 O-acetyltransferase PaAT-1 [Fulvia fulva]KAK4630613.1 O-acetyltransferase PaAT-1 [Fulvia fulva]UJO15251.1 O-acetyltransferase PaAT-1 [Fulvia fulva]WPV12651.1 O-acetyltransferase PaAT-1 [Fulvia fulva]WPV27353.1 O-acetyltransferase PaAT-1 [Fulvia fulva]
MAGTPEREKSLGLLEQGELEVDSDSTLNEDERPPTPVEKTKAQVGLLLEFAASRMSGLRPSFLQVKTNKTSKLRRTAYLDGIRGFAALLVYCLHHGLWAHAIMGGSTKAENTFGWDKEYYFIAFPIVRTFFSGGHYAVATFFVISGYVLSSKPLSLIESGDYVNLGNNVGSALFRRWLRLYVPIIVVTFGFIILPHIGIGSDFKPQGNLRDEIWQWYCDFKNFTNIWNTGGDIILQQQKHVWSIPVEMRGSITIYTAIMAFSRCTRSARLWCECLLCFYFMYIVDGAHYSMFIGGMILCDIDQLSLSDKQPDWIKAMSRYSTPLAYVGMLVSILLGGVPGNNATMEHCKNSPGWYYLCFLKPQAVFDYRWFFLFWAAVLAVLCIPRISWLKRFFEGRFCQYLGRISYMFYLMHGPILWIVGDRLYAAVGFVNYSHALNIPGWADSFKLPQWGPFGLELNYIIAQAILLPLTFYVAELTTALIDDPAIKFAQFCYQLTQPKKESHTEMQQSREQRKASQQA